MILSADQIAKMRACSFLLPEPGGDVVNELIVSHEEMREKISDLAARAAELLTALNEVHGNYLRARNDHS